MRVEAFQEMVDELLGELGDDEVLGIRVQISSETPTPDVGDTLRHRSHVWDDDEDTEEELRGVCAVDARKLDIVWKYYGDDLLLLRGWDWTHGEDEGEIIIRDPVVVGVFKKPW